MANSFNEFFTSIAAGKLNEKIYKNKKMNINNYLSDPCDPCEIMEVINKINGAKASGPHSIPHTILIIIQKTFSLTLSKLINRSFEQGTYFERLKTS